MIKGITLRGKLIDGQYDREIADKVIQAARKLVDVPIKNIHVCGSWGGYVIINCDVMEFREAIVTIAQNMGLEVM